MSQWSINNTDQWVVSNDPQWYPFDEINIVYPVKNFISKAQIPYHFVSEKREHIYETIPANFEFKIRDSEYYFITIDDKYRKIT